MSGFEVEIVFALPDRQSLRSVRVTPGETVAGVVSKSGFREVFADHNIDELAVGIWGREVKPGEVVRKGDRVEVYRPLELDPREARRRLALLGRTMGTAPDQD